MRKELNHQVHYLLTCLLAFLIPIWPLAVPPVIILLALNWIIGGNFRRIFSRKDKLFYLLLFISVYLAYVVGLIHADNRSEAWSNLETKLSLLMLPLIYFSAPPMEKHQ